jgi:bla regulator protein blaR1
MNLVAFLTEATAWVLRTSWEASILLVLMGLLLAAGKSFLAPRVRLVLWGVVGLRFLLPLAPESDFSLFRSVPAFPLNAGLIPPPNMVAKAPPERLRDREWTRDGQVTTAPGRSPLMISVSLVWIAGSLVMLGFGFFRQYRARRQVSRWPEVRDRELIALVREAGIQERVKVVEQSGGGGIGVFGCLRASHLIVPADFMERYTIGQVRGILRHEAEHIRRGDLVWNWALFFIEAIHWFNPLVWFAARQWRNEREILCDDAALRRESAEVRRDYGAALICALESRRLPEARVALLPFISRKNEMKQRLRQIMKNPRYPVIPQIGVALLALAAVVMTFTSAATPLQADEEGKPRAEADGKKDNPERERDANKPKEEEGAKRKEGEGDKPAAGKKNSREQEIFDAYDKDADGTVTAKEMETMMEGKQNSAGRRELRKAVDNADKNADAKLNLEEFEFWYKTGRHDSEAENR